jgi:hypothetical protein
MVLLDKSGGEYADLDNKTNEFIGKLMQRPKSSLPRLHSIQNILSMKWRSMFLWLAGSFCK